MSRILGGALVLRVITCKEICPGAPDLEKRKGVSALTAAERFSDLA